MAETEWLERKIAPQGQRGPVTRSVSAICEAPRPGGAEASRLCEGAGLDRARGRLEINAGASRLCEGAGLHRSRRQLEHQLGARQDRPAPRLARGPASRRRLSSGIEV